MQILILLFELINSVSSIAFVVFEYSDTPRKARSRFYSTHSFAQFFFLIQILYDTERFLGLTWENFFTGTLMTHDEQSQHTCRLGKNCFLANSLLLRFTFCVISRFTWNIEWEKSLESNKLCSSVFLESLQCGTWELDVNSANGR